MMQSRARRVHRWLAAAALLSCGAAAAQQRGRLVVVVVVDQLRYQDLLWLSGEFGPRGFAGLGDPVPVRYEMALTHTAPGHATIATGAWPSVHGVVANRFMEGERPRDAVEDSSCPQWSGGRGVSAAMLQAPTFADALKLATFGRARVLSVGIKDRGALFLAGQSADLALFYDSERGELTSTRCYAPGPPDWLVALQRAHPPAEWKDWVWTQSRPDAVYSRLAEERTEIRDVYGIGPSFPHRIGQGDASPRLFRALRAAPPSTTIVLRAARAGLDAMQLGQRGQTDLLLVCLDGLDYVGHSTGTGSRERMDMLLRMHDELGAFLGDLRARFGDRLSVLLSSDHGGTPTPPTAAQSRVRAQHIHGTVIVAAVEKALDQAFGAHQGWVLIAEDGVLGLRRFPGVDPARAAQIAADALQQVPGVWKAVTQATVADSPAVLRNSWFAGRSDVLFAPAPLTAILGPDPVSVWAIHGSPWADDAVVPLLARAPGFRLKSGETLSVTQIAPAAALLLGVAPPAAAFDAPALMRVERSSIRQ
ncbi:MAG TPA: alkaline phosphatase family protein [Myxococcales bacterium]|nr:alkaline phosphatase family protein [Myxococcales bacterium]